VEEAAVEEVAEAAVPASGLAGNQPRRRRGHRSAHPIRIQDRPSSGHLHRFGDRSRIPRLRRPAHRRRLRWRCTPPAQASMTRTTKPSEERRSQMLKPNFSTCTLVSLPGIQAIPESNFREFCHFWEGRSIEEVNLPYTAKPVIVRLQKNAAAAPKGTAAGCGRFNLRPA